MTATTTAPRSATNVDAVLQTTNAIRQAVESVIDGKPEVVHIALTVLLAQGHLLLEDVPGVGKTMLAKALSRAIGGSMRRIQFTPDLLPSDVTGVNIFNQEKMDFEFKPGPVFANVVVGDEINRASPKTQSALLECMEEHQVSVDGATYRLQSPFIVVATQNPIEMEGTFSLPEAQRDRFMARVSMGYPSAAAEVEMLGRHGDSDPISTLRPVADAEIIRGLIATTHTVYAADAIKQYVVELVRATRQDPALRLGASPRSALHLLRASKAHAILSGRMHVLPDDVQTLAFPVLTHRLVPQSQAQIGGSDVQHLLGSILSRVPVPRIVAHA